MHRRPTLTKTASAVIALGGAVVAAVLVGQPSGVAGVPTGQAVALVEQAVSTEQQVGVPETTQTQMLAMRSTVAHLLKSSQLRHPSAQLKAVRSAGIARLDRIFSGKALAAAQRRLDNAVAQESESDFVAYGGGASDFQVTSAKQLSDGAVAVTLSALTWSGVGQVQGTRVVTARPQNTIIVTSTVEDTAGGPRVVDYSWKFAPGSAP